MVEQADEISEQEKQTRNEMLFTLSERDRGTLAMAITPNEWKRKEIYRFLQEHLKEYSFFDLDLTSHTYTSLYRALQELLPKPILESEPVKYLVSVTGLESSLYKTEDGRIEFSSLVAQLNFERELIFNQPYIILLWISQGFDKELQKKAPDLMHWMSKRFVFEEKGPDGMEVAEAAIEYGTVRKRGKIPERLERIRQLEETWEKLCLHNDDKARLVKDKINLLRIEAGLDRKLFFEIGDFYYDFNRSELALKYFQKALEWDEKDGWPDKGSIYHMMGMVYRKQHQMEKSLEFYRQALEWNEKEKSEYKFGATYHEIGRVYQHQREWDEALRYYRQALEWKKKMGSDASLALTYHQIGMVYQKQRQWEGALKYYQSALKLYEKTGNEYELGGTYHQIGRVEEEKGQYASALAYYEKAVKNEIQYNYPDLPIAQRSLERILQKIEDQPAPGE